MRSVTDIIYTKAGGEELGFDLHMPDSGAFDLFVYYHGGGLEFGDKNGSQAFTPYLTEHGIAVASFDYRMFPKHQYPSFLEDAASAVKYVSEHIGEYGECKRIFVGGSSAGAYMSMMLCFDKKWLADAGVPEGTVDGYFHDAGQPTAHFNVLKYRGVDSRRIIVDETAPLYHIGIDAEYPPMYFVVSDNDMENRYEQTMLTLSTLKHFGYDQSKILHSVMHGEHCAYIGAFDESGESVFGKLVRSFIESVKQTSVKILMIGNSFSQDACTYMAKIAKAGDFKLTTYNAYIGGCSLERHCSNIGVFDEEHCYEFSINGEGTPTITSLDDILRSETYDYVSVQQASRFSGKWDSYVPHLEKLVKHVKEYQPSAKIAIHETWAYEYNSSHDAFPDYKCDRHFMHKRLKECYHKAAELIGADLFIPSGELIASLREDAAFDPERGGTPLTRDGFHMSLGYGRYAVGALICVMLGMKNLEANSFLPDGESIDIEKIKLIKKKIADIQSN